MVRLIALGITTVLFVAATCASFAAKGEGIEQPPRVTADTPIRVATKTCHDVFDAKVAQHMPDRNPGEIRNMLVAGDSYRVEPTKVKGEVWAFPMNAALGVVRVNSSCFE